MYKLKLLISLMLFIGLSKACFAVDKPGRNTPSVLVTGDSVSFLKVTLSSTSASSLGAYSSYRGALTCINGDSTNAVYIGSSTSVTAGGAASFPIFSKQAIQLFNNGSLFGIADAGISSVAVYCITEN